MAQDAPQPPKPAPRLRWLRRFLPLLVLLGVGLWYFTDAPREVTLAIDLSGRRDGLVALRLEVVRPDDRALARHVEHLYSASHPAPVQQRVPIRLSPGEYEADLVLDYGGRTERVERRFTLEKQEEIPLAP